MARELGLIHPEELSDSTFLMAAWQRWGSACLDHVVGGFAFAIWIPSRQELFAARDHTGERPLFYHRGKDLFALASMPKGLLALPGVDHGLRESHIGDWLAALQTDRTKSFFEGVERLPPGHFLRVAPDAFECRQYWHPAEARPTRYKRDEEYADALLEIFDQATEARLRSTRPIGSFLSAGLDSSSVTASAARILAAQGQSLTAFTAIPRPDFNGIVQPWHLASEGEASAEVARLYPNIEHLLLDSLGYDLLPTMKTYTDAWDEPAPNVINLLWLAAIANQAKQRGIGVMLEGAEGNFTISWNSWSILGHFFTHGRWVKLAKTTLGLRRHGALSLKTAARATTRRLFPKWLSRTLIPRKNWDGLCACLVNREWMNHYNLEDRIFESVYCKPSNLIQERSQMSEYIDPGPHRAAVEAVTQIELRDPTADKRIYDFCFSIPPEQYVVGGQSRSLVRRAMKDRLPQSTLMRTTRGQQGADWYLTETESLPELHKEMQLIAQSPLASRALDLPAMQTLFDTWPQSDYHLNAISIRWHYWLSRAISMGYFLRSHEAARAVPSEPGLPADSPAPVAASLK